MVLGHVTRLDQSRSIHFGYNLSFLIYLLTFENVVYFRD